MVHGLVHQTLITRILGLYLSISSCTGYWVLWAAPYMKKGKGDTPKACAGRNKGKEKEERKKEKKEKK